MFNYILKQEKEIRSQVSFPMFEELLRSEFLNVTAVLSDIVAGGSGGGALPVACMHAFSLP